MSPDYLVTEAFHVNSVSANIQNTSVLDIGHAQIDSLKLNVGDSSGVLLSGGTLRKNKISF